MGGNHKKTRRHGKVHELPREIRQEVHGLLIEPDVTYDDITAFLKKKKIDVSRSAIGRYGKDFFDALRQTKIVEEKAKALVSEGADGLVLSEAADKLLSKLLIETLLKGDVDVTEIPRILGDFARLQASSVKREQMKAEIRKKADKAAESIEKRVKKDVSPETLDYIKQVVYGLAG